MEGRCVIISLKRTESPAHRELLNVACAGAFSGLGAMILDVNEIRNADRAELEEIARRYGR